MITLEPITSANESAFRAIRLRALACDPMSFGSTHARESQFTPEEWAVRILRWNGEHGIGYLAMDDDVARGLAGGLLDEEDANKVMLVSMWTASTHRRLGVGRLLVEAVIAWAQARGAGVVRLMVTGNNDDAIRFYERMGFIKTGYTEPYPNDPALSEYEMAKAI